MIKDVDPERIEKLVSAMREAVLILRELGAMKESEFLGDKHKGSSAKYNFIVAIEAAIDLASHLISRKGFRAPEDYSDTFRVLREAGVIESDFALELEKMARFRNRLVHRYWDVDPKEVWKILHDKVDDVEKYITHVGAYVSSEGSPTGHDDSDE
jgi:uncharacterized protein YutE (UPF0331/DUF86 family)